jgi:hypothetical protein
MLPCINLQFETHKHATSILKAYYIATMIIYFEVKEKEAQLHYILFGLVASRNFHPSPIMTAPVPRNLIISIVIRPVEQRPIALKLDSPISASDLDLDIPSENSVIFRISTCIGVNNSSYRNHFESFSRQNPRPPLWPMPGL